MRAYGMHMLQSGVNTKKQDPQVLFEEAPPLAGKSGRGRGERDAYTVAGSAG